MSAVETMQRVVDIGGLSLMEAAWGCGSVSGNLAGHVASAAPPPSLSRFLLATLGYSGKELVDRAIAWQA
jgi:hypothetical protein